MHDKHKVIVGSLVGAIAIHAAFVACGRVGSTPETGEAGADGNTEGMADGGEEPSLLDAFVDAIATLIDGTTKDAMAGVDSGAGGSDGGTCGCTVSLSGPVPTTPASENTAQLAHGTLTSLSNAGSIAVTGPFVLTDATTTPSGAGASADSTWGASLVVQPSAASCTALSANAESLPGYLTSVFSSGFQTSMAIHGGRYLIPAGQMLCVYAPGGSGNIAGALQWAGFTPYQ